MWVCAPPTTCFLPVLASGLSRVGFGFGILVAQAEVTSSLSLQSFMLLSQSSDFSRELCEVRIWGMLGTLIFFSQRSVGKVNIANACCAF